MFRILKRWLCCVLLVSWAAPGVASSPLDYRGVWYDRARSGHGLDVHVAGSTLFAVFYTFDRDGEPTWYTAQAVPGASFASPVYRFQRDGSGVVGAGRVVGQFDMRLGASPANAGCNDGVARDGVRLATLAVTIDGESIEWCLEPITAVDDRPEGSLSGVWWVGPDENGWGIGNTVLPSAVGNRLISLIYHYDRAGEPRWALAGAESTDLRFSSRASYVQGFCRTCAPRALVFRDGGSATFELSTPRHELDLGNRVILDLRYPAGAGGEWQRDRGIGLLSGMQLPAGSVATRAGIVVGRSVAAGEPTRIFEGIPFAASPVGARRWRAPVPAPERNRVLRNTTMAPACPQAPGPGFFGAIPPVIDEDCLYLNVWSADLRPQAPKPVMVWIHGGGLVQGGASQQDNGGSPVYDGATFARRDVVLVSINYRLGALGFAAFNALMDENPAQPGAGNYGFLDQVAALEWVRDNIAAFGGDPARVTIFGESAGGVSVCAHLASPLSAGLFHNAIMQSGNCLNALPQLRTTSGGREAAVTQGERLVQRLGCAGASAAGVAVCLRSKTASEIVVAAQGTTNFNPVGEKYGFVIDDHAFPRSPGAALREGVGARVPFIIGVNEDEATTLLPDSEKPTTVAGYEALVRARLPTIANEVLALYPGSQYLPVWRAWAAVVTDTSFVCPAQRASRDHSAAGNSSYAYYFTHRLPGAVFAPLGAFHAIEIPFLFSAMTQYGNAEQQLAARMQALWASFAQDGVADASGVVAWPAHAASGALGLELNGAFIAPRADYRKVYCDFWARYIAL